MEQFPFDLAKKLKKFIFLTKSDFYPIGFELKWMSRMTA